jgi:uncharacterized protein involved in exopolysaccharide biosynthesis/Mrp family chromosome partitioning ATPase
MTRLIAATNSPAPLTLAGYSSPLPPPPEGTASVGDLWRILWRRRGMIIATAAICFVGALLYGLLTAPLYTATAAIIIDPRDRVVVSNDVNPSGISPDGGITQVESQGEVVGSSGVLLRAIKATHLTEDPEFGGPGMLAGILAWFGDDSELRATPEQVQARTLATLKKRLAVKRADRVLVLNLSVTAQTAEKAARLANAIAQSYLADQAQAKQQAGEAASDALTARLADQRARVEQAAERVERYKSAHNIVAASGQLVSDAQLNDASTQLAAAQTRVAALKAQVDQIDQARRARGAVDSTAEVMQSAVISRLREQEATLVQRQAELAAQYGPRHPSIISINSQLSQVRGLIGAELGRISGAAQADYQRALADERLLEARFNHLRAATIATGQASVELRELERDLDADRSIYAAFLQRAQETREQAGIDTTNARIITQAMPPQQKSWPPLPLLLIGAIGSGLGLGAGIALVREYAGPTVLSRAQIENALGAPVVGLLPATALANAPGGGGQVSGQALAVAGLALRRLFELEGIGHDPGSVRSLLVTSGGADDAARVRACRLLATAAAMRGQRVLLVDGKFADEDDRRGDGRSADAPRGGRATAGLLDVLRGDCPLDAVIDVAPPTRVALLESGRGRAGVLDGQDRGQVKRMLHDARQHFDLMVIDGGTLSENLRIAPLVSASDEVMLVARLGATAQSDVIATAEAAAVMGRPISATLLFDAGA